MPGLTLGEMDRSSTAPLVFRLGLQTLAFVHVVVLAVHQFPVSDSLPAPEAYDDRFHIVPTSLVQTDHRPLCCAGQVTRVMPECYRGTQAKGTGVPKRDKDFWVTAEAIREPKQGPSRPLLPKDSPRRPPHK